MKELTIKRCKDCPAYSYHTRRKVRFCGLMGDDGINRQVVGSTIPKWCPIHKNGGLKLEVVRNKNKRTGTWLPQDNQE